MIPRPCFRARPASRRFLGLVLLPLLLSTACSSPAESGRQPVAAAPAPDAGLAAGRVIFTQRCAVCHGPDGRKGLNGAHDLTKSNLNATGRVYIVTNGLGKMPSFKKQLTPAEIDQVVAYSLTLH